MRNDKSTFVCAKGSRCSRFRFKVTKKRTTLSKCRHEHITLLLTGTTGESEEVPQDKEETDIFDNHVWLENTSRFLFKHRQLDMSDPSIKLIEQLVLERNKQDKWPKAYQACIGQLG